MRKKENDFRSIAIIIAIIYTMYVSWADAVNHTVLLKHTVDIESNIGQDSFRKTSPNQTRYDNLCKKSDDFKKIVCDKVEQLMMRLGRWLDTDRKAEAIYECNSSLVSMSNIQNERRVNAFKCTSLHFDHNLIFSDSEDDSSELDNVIIDSDHEKSGSENSSDTDTVHSETTTDFDENDPDYEHLIYERGIFIAESGSFQHRLYVFTPDPLNGHMKAIFQINHFDFNSYAVRIIGA